MAIPKKIHYVWVGGKEKPKDVIRCINSWKKKFIGYEIIEWNEKNFNIESNQFTKNAYDLKKWAFVSDYIRLYALYNHGGIYLDTDVIAVNSLDELLKNKAFIGFENDKFISAAVMAAEKNHEFIYDLLKYYDNLDKKEFNFEDNNSIIVTEILKNNYKLIQNNKNQVLRNELAVYNDRILSNPSKFSKTIHIFTGTWLEEKNSFKKRICQLLKYRLTSANRANLYYKFFKK